ncbi:hypothetical protein ACFQU2_00940 [Siccirubricoccus deserti]
MLDGDTLRLGDRVLRLAALEVPDRGRATCRDGASQPSDCAGLAAESLARLVADRAVECRVQGATGSAAASAPAAPVGWS